MRTVMGGCWRVVGRLEVKWREVKMWWVGERITERELDASYSFWLTYFSWWRPAMCGSRKQLGQFDQHSWQALAVEKEKWPVCKSPESSIEIGFSWRPFGCLCKVSTLCKPGALEHLCCTETVYDRRQGTAWMGMIQIGKQRRYSKRLIGMSTMTLFLNKVASMGCCWDGQRIWKNEIVNDQQLKWYSICLNEMQGRATTILQNILYRQKWRFEYKLAHKWPVADCSGWLAEAIVTSENTKRVTQSCRQ